MRALDEAHRMRSKRAEISGQEIGGVERGRKSLSLG